MKIKNLKLVALCVLAASCNAFAAPVWKQKMVVNGVQALPDGNFIIYGPPGADSASCAEGRLFYVQAGQNGVTLASVKSFLSTALTAFAMGKTVTFLYDNGTTNCNVNTLLVNL